MSSTAATLGGHPIAEFVERLRVVLDGLAHAPAWSMTRQQQAATIVALTRQRARIDELLLRVLAAGDRNDVALTSAATSTTAWVAHAVRPAGAVHADVKLAFALDEDFVATQHALAAGHIDAERARVVVRAIQALPIEAVERDPGLARRAEQHLLGLAVAHDASSSPGWGGTCCMRSTRTRPRSSSAASSRSRSRTPRVRRTSRCTTTATAPQPAGSRSPSCRARYCVAR